MKDIKLIFTYGFAIFAMFFGSGNLVFPLEIGLGAGNQWLFGFLGLFFTGILLPFCGLFVIKLHKGSYQSFFNESGKIAGFMLPLVTLSLLGAFGVVPRCITVAHGGMEYLFEGLSLTCFSLAFCAITFVLCLKDHIMVNILGKWLSPLLVASLVILICVGVYYAPDPISQTTPTIAFQEGFFIGYQTMDLFAAFFFSALVFTQIQALLPETADHRATIKAALMPSIIGATMLALVYLGFVFLGSRYAGLISTIQPEVMLPTIATHALGRSASLLIAVAIIFSCLTTAVALNNIYAQYIITTFKLRPSKFPLILLVTTGVSFWISLLDFKGITAFLGPLLQITYPGLIFLTLFGIYTKKHHTLKQVVFYGVTMIMIIRSFIE